MCLRIIVEHRNCWSEILSRYPDITDELVSQNVENDSIEGTVAIYMNNYRESTFHQFILDLRSHPNVISIDNVINIKESQVKLLHMRTSKKG